MSAVQHGFDAVGLDFDSGAIDAGRAFWRTSRLHSLAIKEYFAQAKERFHVITFYEVLEHLEDPLQFIQELKDYLHPNGLISFSVPNRDSRLNAIYRRLIPDIDYPPHHLTRWSKNALRGFLKQNGFETELLLTSAPSVSDQIFDLLRTRARFLPMRVQQLMAAALALLLRPADIYLSRATSHEGRGTFIIARLR